MTMRFIDLPVRVQNTLRKRMQEAARKIGWREGVIEMDFTYRGDELSAWCVIRENPKRRIVVRNLITEVADDP